MTIALSQQSMDNQSQICKSMKANKNQSFVWPTPVHWMQHQFIGCWHGKQTCNKLYLDVDFTVLKRKWEWQWQWWINQHQPKIQLKNQQNLHGQQKCDWMSMTKPKHPRRKQRHNPTILTGNINRQMWWKSNTKDCFRLNAWSNWKGWVAICDINNDMWKIWPNYLIAMNKC